MNRKETLTDFLTDRASERPVSFHMPGHKGRPEIYRHYGYGTFADRLIQGDITEVPGADALQQPSGIIRELMDDYASHYHSLHTELLVNGSSSGIMAAIMGSVPRGGKLIMGRASHKSAYSAIRLGGIEPVYEESEYDEELGLQGGMSPDAILEAVNRCPDASAVFITSPNYYGVLSDISRIAEIVHEAGMILITDQAHGAHLLDFDMRERELANQEELEPPAYRSAELLGSDLVINSIHKSLFGFTSTAILNVCSRRPDTDKISRLLTMLQTTSPSYILMGSLDASLRIMENHGREIIDRWNRDLDRFYSRARSISGLTVIEKDPRWYDRTKINISLADRGVTGERLQEDLIYRNIWPEMVHGNYVLLLTGPGNMSGDYEKLFSALDEISENYGIVKKTPRSEKPFSGKLQQCEVPSECEKVPVYEAVGRVLYDPVVPYPPGTPLVCPGEVLTYEAITHIAGRLQKGDQLIGVDDEGCVLVGKEQ